MTTAKEEDLVDLIKDQMSRALVEVTMVNLMENQMARALVKLMLVELRPKVSMAELMLVV